MTTNASERKKSIDFVGLINVNNYLGILKLFFGHN